MRCYKVSAKVDGKTVIKLAGTTALARDTKNNFVVTYGVQKKSVEIEEIDVPLAKTDLLDFINGIYAVANGDSEEDNDEAA